MRLNRAAQLTLTVGVVPTILLGLYLGHAFSTTPSSAPTDTPTCAQEDSPGPCYWDAGSRGNGAGQSFWVDADQKVHYLN